MKRHHAANTKGVTTKLHMNEVNIIANGIHDVVCAEREEGGWKLWARACLAKREKNHENGASQNGRTTPFGAALLHAEAQIDPNDGVQQRKDVGRA